MVEISASFEIRSLGNLAVELNIDSVSVKIDAELDT